MSTPHTPPDKKSTLAKERLRKPIRTTSVRATCNFQNASLIPTSAIVYDPERDRLYCEVSIIQHKQNGNMPVGIQTKLVDLPFGDLVIKAIRERVSSPG